jgi:hypothetical protein
MDILYSQLFSFGLSLKGNLGGWRDTFGNQSWKSTSYNGSFTMCLIHLTVATSQITVQLCLCILTIIFDNMCLLHQDSVSTDEGFTKTIFLSNNIIVIVINCNNTFQDVYSLCMCDIQFLKYLIDLFCEFTFFCLTSI